MVLKDERKYNERYHYLDGLRKFFVRYDIPDYILYDQDCY